MAQTEAQKRATANYRKKMKHITVAFSPQEMDMYNYLEEQGNKAGYIKELIRRDMEDLPMTTTHELLSNGRGYTYTVTNQGKDRDGMYSVSIDLSTDDGSNHYEDVDEIGCSAYDTADEIIEWIEKKGFETDDTMREVLYVELLGVGIDDN